MALGPTYEYGLGPSTQPQREAYESRNNLLPGVATNAGFSKLATATAVENQAAKFATVATTGRTYEDAVQAEVSQANNLNALIPKLAAMQSQSVGSIAAKASDSPPWGLIVGIGGVGLIVLLLVLRR